MSSTQTAEESRTTVVPATETLDLKLEVLPLPVSDVDRAKRFYEGLGWRLDADFAYGDVWRVVQMTPPGSPTSVMFGKGFTTAAPGSVNGAFLVVNDVQEARAELARRGVEVSEVFHFEGDLLSVSGVQRRVPGPDSNGRSYFSFASFADPDGNTWLLQEVTARFPGRGLSSDVATMTELLQEAEARHGEYERVAPKHHWSPWYAAYVVARQRGKSADDAARDASLHTDRTSGGVRA